jgi:hypothetical protein
MRELSRYFLRFLEEIFNNSVPERYFAYRYPHRLFRSLIAFALALASALLDAPQAFSDKSSRVGLPSLYSGPGIFPIRARNDALRGLSPDLTGGFRSLPGLARS